MRLWTRPEANEVLAEIRVAIQNARALQFAAGQEANGLGQGGARSDSRPSMPAAEGLRTMLCSLSRNGILVRDVEAGILDFASRDADGNPMMLCWQVDEPAVRHWHSPQTGFASRKPLDDGAA